MKETKFEEANLWSNHWRPFHSSYISNLSKHNHRKPICLWQCQLSCSMKSVHTHCNNLPLWWWPNWDELSLNKQVSETGWESRLSSWSRWRHLFYDLTSQPSGGGDAETQNTTHSPFPHLGEPILTLLIWVSHICKLQVQAPCSESELLSVSLYTCPNSHSSNIPSY